MSDTKPREPTDTERRILSLLDESGLDGIDVKSAAHNLDVSEDDAAAALEALQARGELEAPPPIYRRGALTPAEAGHFEASLDVEIEAVDVTGHAIAPGEPRVAVSIQTAIGALYVGLTVDEAAAVREELGDALESADEEAEIIVCDHCLKPVDPQLAEGDGEHEHYHPDCPHERAAALERGS